MDKKIRTIVIHCSAGWVGDDDRIVVRTNYSDAKLDKFAYDHLANSHIEWWVEEVPGDHTQAIWGMSAGVGMDRTDRIQDLQESDWVVNPQTYMRPVDDVAADMAYNYIDYGWFEDPDTLPEEEWMDE